MARRAQAIRLLVMDVDGVLTDGRMILSERGDELKAFHAHDGVGLALARRAGLHTAFVTGETARVSRRRGARLGVDAVILGARRKAAALDRLAARYRVSLGAVAYVGDDLLDIPAMERAGLAIAPADAAPEVRRLAHVVTRRRGGAGVVREAVELILRARGSWPALVAAYVRAHGGTAARSARRRGR